MSTNDVRGSGCVVRLLSAENFSAVQEHCPPKNSRYTIRHSLLAIRRRFRLGRLLAIPDFR